MRVLYVTTIALTMRFFPQHIKMLISEGHTVELACNCSECEVPEAVAEMGLKTYNVPFSRSPFSADNIKAYSELKAIIENGKYDIVHTHTPNASVLARMACRKKRKQGLRVFYTAHGFHFYRGAPLLNWLVFYPVEKLCSRFTDVLVTINDEDYSLAKEKLLTKKTVKVPGVGVDLEHFKKTASDDVGAVKEALGVANEDKLLIYVSELNENKNQMSLLYMISYLRKKRTDVKLVLVGTGDSEERLKKKCGDLGISHCVIFTGYRNDVPALLRAADITVPSSIREGLPLNVVEAMACNTSVVAYDNRGHRTIIKDGVNGYLVPLNDYRAMAEKIDFLLSDPDVASRIQENALADIRQFSTECVVEKMRELYQLH